MMISGVAGCLLAIALLELHCIDAYQRADPVVSVEQGSVRGKIRKGLDGQEFYSFQGIPYGEAPTGELRFKASNPPKPWDGILNAIDEKDTCYSPHNFLPLRVGSEDCLYLNVYTPKIPQNEESTILPVMVWIYGGAFTRGSSTSLVYGPEYLIAHDVVFVSFNYRLGTLGFLGFDDPSLDVPGNAGIKDQILALQWVQKNIAAFGGNPNDVTIFGESAGAASVHLLVLSPSAKGLFHKAIMESGSALNYWSRGTRYAKKLAELLDFESEDEEEILKLLRELPASKIIEAQEKITYQSSKHAPRLSAPLVEKPTNEANVITEEPMDIIQSGNYNQVPILMGYNNLEGIYYEITQFGNLEADFVSQVPAELNLEEGSEEFDEIVRRMKKFYYGDAEPTKENIGNFVMLMTDNSYIYAIQTAAKNHAVTSTEPVYLYRFSVDAGYNLLKKSFEIIAGQMRPGAAHADELGYLFKTIIHPSTLGESVEDITVKRMTKLWTNFAKFGNPNPADEDDLIDVAWEPVKSEKEINFLDIGEELSAGVNPEAERMAFWESIYAPKNSNSKL